MCFRRVIHCKTLLKENIMKKDNAIGMFMGLFVGDALGAPLEFTEPVGNGIPTTEMTGGGWLDVGAGEWTDDGAMAMCIAHSYLHHKSFNPENIFNNFRAWKNTGKYGTRNVCFDIGSTCKTSINRGNPTYPYAGSSDEYASGNGALMRIAPIVLFNHASMRRSVAECVAVSLMTHGSASCVEYVSAFAADLHNGVVRHDKSSGLRNVALNNNNLKNTVMYAYNIAHHCVSTTSSFEQALVKAVNFGGDADTNGAITGMLAGVKYGLRSIPSRWLDVLYQRDILLGTADMLWNKGCIYAENVSHYD